MSSVSPVLVALVALVVPLVALSAFFSSSEIAIFSLPEDWGGEAAADDTDAAHLADLRSDPHRLLVTILVGNNLVNVATSSIITAVLVLHLPTGWAVTVATVLASFVILVFGEIVPKSYGLGNASRWALKVAYPLTLAGRGLHPLVLLFDGLTRRMNVVLGGDQGIERPYLDD